MLTMLNKTFSLIFKHCVSKTYFMFQTLIKPRWRPGLYSILYIRRRRGTGVSVANTFKGFFHRRFLITNHAWRARISVRPQGNFIQFFSRWICRFYHFNFAVKCWHHSTPKAKPFFWYKFKNILKYFLSEFNSWREWWIFSETTFQ